MTQPFPDHPQLRGNYAPIRMECDVPDLVVQGEIPSALQGSYYRIGPDPLFAPPGQYHWFGGDGMVHGFHIREGKVTFRNRWVRTQKWQMEREAGRALFNPLDPTQSEPSVAGKTTDGVANTNILWHGGRLLALEEQHAPFEIDPLTLESKGSWDFGGALRGPMTAHPKVDPETGEMLFFGYMAKGMFTRDMSYHVVDAAGNLTRSVWFEAPYASMVHDFIVTRDYVVFPIFPLSGSLERAQKGGPPLAWEPELGTHVGVMPRDGGADDIRWMQTDPCFVFHPMNAYVQDNLLIADMMQFEEAPLFPKASGGWTDKEKAKARLARWTIDLDAESLKREYLDDIVGEFPRLDERRAGLTYRYGYYAGTVGESPSKSQNAIVFHDHKTGQHAIWAPGGGDAVGEPVFVPRSAQAPEGDGWLIDLVYRAAENRSDLVVLDAQNVADGPIACAQLPHRVPFGFHGNWRAA